MQTRRLVGGGILAGTVFVLALLGVGVGLHRGSIEGDGRRFLVMDLALLAAYGAAGLVACRQRAGNANAAALVGAQVGLLLAAALIANHLIEAFVPVRTFALVIGPVLLQLALLGAAGAAAWQRTRSLLLAISGGLWAGIVAVLGGLSFAIAFNLIFAAHVDWQMREAFAASGMPDAGSFRVRNILESSSEILVRMPLMGICLALVGAAVQAWVSRGSRRVALAASWIAPVLFAAGAFALWHANGIERAARPPFVMSGVLLAGIALCAAYPVWSVVRGKSRVGGEKR